MVTFKMAHAQSKLIERMSCKGESQSILARTEGETMKGEFWDLCVGLYRLRLLTKNSLTPIKFKIGWVLDLV